MASRRVAVVGAGLAGLACADGLERVGWDVWMFDKGRAPGGRMASRTLDGADFDHGAQFATARGHNFQSALAAWGATGVAAVWPAASSEHALRWVGVPTMAAIPAQLAATLARQPQQARHVGGLHRPPEGWRVRHHPAAEMAPGAVSRAGGELAGPFDVVVVALPGPQAAALLATAGHRFAAPAAFARYDPCWTVLATFARRFDFPDVLRPEDGPIAWAAREASRPGRPADPERLVIQASGDWSRARLEEPEAVVREALLQALPDREPASVAAAHRWRFAKVEQALGEPCLWDAQIGLGACGDWCLGGRLEAAWDSGQAMAAAIAQT